MPRQSAQVARFIEARFSSQQARLGTSTTPVYRDPAAAPLFGRHERIRAPLDTSGPDMLVLGASKPGTFPHPKPITKTKLLHHRLTSFAS